MTVRGSTQRGSDALTTLAAGLLWILPWTLAAAADPGITADTIRIGGVLDLEGRSRGLGQGMKAGIEAALHGKEVAGRQVQYITLNDSYTPEKTEQAARRLVEQGVFAMLGNVGTPTAKVSLPILAEARVPAVGFFTGAGLLRPGRGEIINFRASYVQETEAVIRGAIDNGVMAKEICAYVQNDAYGMAGVTGIRRALRRSSSTDAVIERLDMVLAQRGKNPARNDLGPIGVYKRNTFVSKPGYQSLKNWESASGTRCRVVVTVGTYAAVARFAGYARYKGENWVVSAVSFTGADNLDEALTELNVRDGVIMTQVVPPLDSSLPIVVEARRKLGSAFGWVSLEGYIVGRLWLKAMLDADGSLSRASALAALRGKQFNLGGLRMDFTDDNQASDLVVLTQLSENGFEPMRSSQWPALLAQ